MSVCGCRHAYKHTFIHTKTYIQYLHTHTGIPLVYDLDENLKPIRHPQAVGALNGRYVGDADMIASKVNAVANQTASKK